MGIIGGFGGHIAKGDFGGGGSEAMLGCVRNWGISHSSSPGELRCSGSKNGTIRTVGNNDVGGQFGGYGAEPPLWPGDTFWFAGAISGDGESAFGAGLDAMVNSVVITWNQEGAEPISYVVNFGGASEITYGTVTVPADTSVPAPLPSRGCALKVAPAPFSSFTAIPEIRTMSLTLTKDNKSAHTANGAGWPEMVEGNLNGEIACSFYADGAVGWANVPKPNDIRAVQMFIDDTDSYLIKAVMFNDLGDVAVDIEGGAIAGGSLSAGLTLFNKISGTWTEGIITAPDAGTIWP